MKVQETIAQTIDTIHGTPGAYLMTGLTGSAKAMMAEVIRDELQQPMLVVTANLLQAQKMAEDLQKIANLPVYIYPAEELIAADLSISSPELRAERIEALDFLARQEAGIIVSPIAGLRRRLPTLEEWNRHRLILSVGEDLPDFDWTDTLISMGYKRQGMVTTPGEFSMRGGIIDIFPIYEAYPYRMELFDTEIDSIRAFSAEDQRSLHKVENLTLLPATEFFWTEEKRQAIANRLEKQLTKTYKKVKKEEVKAKLSENIQADIEALRTGRDAAHLQRYASLLDEQTTFLGDYFSSTGIVIFDEIGRIQETVESLEKEEQDWVIDLLEEGKIVHDIQLSLSWKEIIHQLPERKLFFSLFSRAFSGLGIVKSFAFSCKPMQQFHGQMHVLQHEYDRFKKERAKVFIAVEGAARQEKVATILEDYQIPATILSSDESVSSPGVYVVDLSLNDGFELPLQQLAVITDQELFQQKPKKKKKVQKLSNAERIKSYSEISPGDYVVHIHHGIGKYIGMETLEVGGIHKDYLHIRYRAEDKLFVPADQIDLIQKYVGSEDREPKVHKLGGAEWKKTKTRVTTAVKDIADELIKLYAKREAEKGFAFEKDGEMQQQFESAFFYEETDDQLRSIQEVKEDMEKERPMDRLLCGDVGYGKTEVAIRAAFKAVQDSKQVAFLVPTTILAQQHFETIKERFRDFPVEVSLLNRFRTKKEQAETLKGLKEGTVDVVVGTHRLLSKDVVYRDLGLLIVDEEQRFGVTHKEKLKQLKTNVDVLTLTATPIPRTLHMSMIGVRDLSVIETPPADRYPVQTYVMEHNGAIVREAIEREMARGGQTFYLYNRVEDMTKKVDEIQALVPQARVGYVHGQMPESELEGVLLPFLEGEYDVLVTTTIIETGMDIPNVNTLIVQDADRMGLSQLYQLRGRVGRSNRVAYAYFTYRPDKVLTDVAESRLQAIKEFTELGSGFKIAMRDLSIRGAGNLLGAEQHGFIDSVGFDLYAQLLQEAVEEKQTGIVKADIPDVEIQLPIDAYFADDFISDGFQKIQMYKRVKAIDSETGYFDLVDELTDRFGDLPVEAERLLRIARMKVWANKAGVESIKQSRHLITIQLSPEGTRTIDGGKLVEQSMEFGRAVGFQMTNQQTLAVTIDTKQTKKITPFDVVEKMVELLPQSQKTSEGLEA
nr:transcription-repair coupling factor [Paenisporosarcina cavernae]